MHTPVALTIALLALGATACGSEESKAPSQAPAKPAASQGMPVSQYSQEVDGMLRVISDTRGEYFHGGNSKGEIRRHSSDLQKAFSEAASQLEAIEPPAVAADLHTQLVALWKQRASELEKLLGAKPFKTGAIDDLMAEMDHDTVYDQIYTLPQ